MNILLFADGVVFLLLFMLISKKKMKNRETGNKNVKVTVWAMSAALIFCLNSMVAQGAVFASPSLAKGVVGVLGSKSAVSVGADQGSSETPTPAPIETYTGAAKGKNVIVIQLEAFQNILIGNSLNGTEITPNLNALIKESLYYKNAISQIASGNTSDAEFLLNTSLYPLKKEAPFKKYANLDYKGLPYIMKTNGYYSATFHTNDSTFWNRKNMYPSLGFNRWYDKKDFEAREVVGYGASDGILYGKVLEKLKLMRTKKMPVYYNIITLSNHHPFRTPSWMKATSFGKEADKTDAGRYVKTANYTDRQLGIFFENLKKENLYDDALIVIYGDHFGISTKTDADKKVIESFLGRPYDGLDTYNIPLIIKLPGSVRTGTIDMPAGQVDLMPTILNLVGYENTDRKMYGQDLLNTTENEFGLRFYASDNTYVDNTGLYTGNGSYFSFDRQPGEARSADPAKIKRIYDRINENDAYLKKLPKIK